MEPSPYTPGSLPEYLAGRGSERELIRSTAARLSMLGRSGGPLLAFHAPRGLGKTSLLRMAQRDALAEGFLTVWVTGRADQAMAPDLAQALGTSVERESFGSRAKALLHRLDQVQVEFGVPGAKLGATINTESQAGIAPAGVVEELLEDAARFARNHDRKGLLVLIDEFQEAQVGDRKSLLIALQHFDGAPDPAPVAAIAAGLPALPSAVTEAATFGERSRFVELGLLREVAVAEALRVPAEHHGVGWADAAIDAAIGLAEGYPHKVQLVGEAAWNVARPEPGDTITHGQVRQAAEHVEAQMLNLSRTRLTRATPAQRRFLAAMATAGDDAAARSDIAGRMGVESRALSPTRQELIDRGYIEPAGHGMLRFTIPGFGRFIRDQDDLGPSPIS